LRGPTGAAGRPGQAAHPARRHAERATLDGVKKILALGRHGHQVQQVHASEQHGQKNKLRNGLMVSQRHRNNGKSHTVMGQVVGQRPSGKNDSNRLQWIVTAEYVSRERIAQVLHITHTYALKLVRTATAKRSDAALNKGDLKYKVVLRAAIITSIKRSRGFHRMPSISDSTQVTLQQESPLAVASSNSPSSSLAADSRRPALQYSRPGPP